jgi:hypothetical protein
MPFWNLRVKLAASSWNNVGAGMVIGRHGGNIFLGKARRRWLGRLCSHDQRQQRAGTDCCKNEAHSAFTIWQTGLGPA